jgi:tRNA A37 threonylcarbamoyladenosine dehydratase
METSSEHLELLRNQQKTTNSIYKPEFQRLSKPKDRLKFNDLLKLPGISVADYIMDQVKEYIKFRNPDKKFSAEELESLAKTHTNNIPLEEYGVWVYYPWSNRLVHILDEEEFVEVRTSRNQYKITREERDLLAKKKIGVIGLSVGQSVSVTLAMERICGELRLADFDLLELTNLNRIRTGVHNLGLPKVYSVAREIAEIDPYLKVTCFPEGLLESNLDEYFTKGGLLDLLVEESDGFDIKILSRYKARELKVPVIMEASDRCMVDVERFDLEPKRKILHGIVRHLDVNTLKKLKTNEEKIPYMLDILGLKSTSPRLKASMIEMQHSINTWPQLASAVTMGGGITADVSRRILLNQFTGSGRYYVDIDQLIGNKPKAKKSGQRSIAAATQKNKPQKSGLTLAVMKQAALKYKVETSAISEADLKKIVNAAILAPSYGNKQAWKWLSHRKQLFLFFDKKLADSVNDTGNQNALVSMGTALENAFIKAKEIGYEANIRLNPGISNSGLIASFSFNKTKTSGHHLARYIDKRHTNRKSGNGKNLDQKTLNELKSLVKEIKGASLTIISDPKKIAEIGRIEGSIERIRLLNPVTHHDYFTKEIKWDDHNKGAAEGLAVKTLELPVNALTGFEVISDPEVSGLIHKWEKGTAFEKLVQYSVSSSSAIGLITMPSDSLTNLVNGGRLAERIWLTATKNNLAFHPISVSLSFLKLLSEKNKNSFLSEKNFSELKKLKVQFSLIFSELNSREGVFLFRLFEAGKASGRSLRKPLNELYFKS